MERTCIRTPLRRFYLGDAVYFITTVTHRRHPFFREPIFADLFAIDLWFAGKIREFRLFGYTVVGDHVHVLVQPFGSSNISDILGSLKRNVSRDINDMIQDSPLSRITAGDDSNRPLPRDFETMRATVDAMRSAHPSLSQATLERHFQLIFDLRTRFRRNSKIKSSAMEFRWQKSFYDHVIRGEEDFLKHLEYIFGNAVKHKLAREPQDWRWMWVFGMDEPKEFQ